MDALTRAPPCPSLALPPLGNELGDNAGAFKLIGGLGLIVAIFSRHIFRTLKRKFV